MPPGSSSWCMLWYKLTHRLTAGTLCLGGVYTEQWDGVEGQQGATLFSFP